jgi:hypothetical protein
MNNGLKGAVPFLEEVKTRGRIAYAMRRVPEGRIARLLPCPDSPQPGDIVLAELEKIGKNSRLELPNGRRCHLHEGDHLAVVFGNRYATMQFEGYARADGTRCDLLSMGGVCGHVASKHASVVEPSKLRLLGAIGDDFGHPLRLRDFAVAPVHDLNPPHVIVVCGTSMEAGKTYTAACLVKGLQQQGYSVAGIKLTGTATGRDTWSMLDAGARVALDFVDGGYPSTYLCTAEELLSLYDLLIHYAASQQAQVAVVEIADGLLQRETAALLQSERFTSSVGAWLFAAGDPLGAAAGVRILRDWGIGPLAVSGIVSMSPLGRKEVEVATGLPCVTAKEVQCRGFNVRVMDTVPRLVPASLAASASVAA